MMVEGLGTNVATAAGYSKMIGELDPADCMARLVFETQKVQGGNLASVEATLMAQAMTLNAMFTQLANEASKMTIVDHIDRFTRLASRRRASVARRSKRSPRSRTRPWCLHDKRTSLRAHSR
jgi:hypothetical protein